MRRVRALPDGLKVLASKEKTWLVGTFPWGIPNLTPVGVGSVRGAAEGESP